MYNRGGIFKNKKKSKHKKKVFLSLRAVLVICGQHNLALVLAVTRIDGAVESIIGRPLKVKSFERKKLFLISKST